jgi:hypothetical protein
MTLLLRLQAADLSEQADDLASAAAALDATRLPA